MPTAEHRPARILVTRPAHLAQGLSDGIRQLGAVPVSLPLLQIVPAQPATKVDVCGIQIVIFVSVNAVKYGLPQLPTIPAGLQVGAIGQATATSLANAGIAVSLVPERYDSEGLLALAALQHAQGKNVLIVRGQGGRETLAEQLRARGANVTYLEVYRRECPTWQQVDVQTALSSDIITVTSADALDNLVQLAQLPGAEGILSKPLMVFHERIAGRARELGFTLKAIVSAKPGDDALLFALRDWLTHEKG